MLGTVSSSERNLTIGPRMEIPDLAQLYRQGDTQARSESAWCRRRYSPGFVRCPRPTCFDQPVHAEGLSETWAGAMSGGGRSIVASKVPGLDPDAIEVYDLHKALVAQIIWMDYSIDMDAVFDRAQRIKDELENRKSTMAAVHGLVKESAVAAAKSKGRPKSRALVRSGGARDASLSSAAAASEGPQILLEEFNPKHVTRRNCAATTQLPNGTIGKKKLKWGFGFARD